MKKNRQNPVAFHGDKYCIFFTILVDNAGLIC